MVFYSGHSSAVRAVDPFEDAGACARALILEAGALRLAVNTDVVREIAACTSLTSPVVQAAGYLGDQILRRDSVPVFDACVLLGRPLCTERPTRILVLETGQGDLALGATRIVCTSVYSETQSLTLPCDEEARLMRYARGVLTMDGLGEALLLDHARLFAQQSLVNIANRHAMLNPVV